MSDRSWLVPAIEAADQEIRSLFSADSTIAQGSAFAAWAMAVVGDDVGRTEAAEATSVGDGPGGDRGIDGWIMSEAGDELIVMQAKYASDPKQVRVDPSVLRELQSAYNRVAYSEPSQLNSSERDIQAASVKVRENGGQVRIILAAWMTSTEETRSRASEAAALFEAHERFELWDVWDLAAQWSQLSSDADLSNVTVRLRTTTTWVDMPAPVPEGVLEAGVVSLDAFTLADQLRPYSSRAISPNVRFHLGHQGPVNRHIVNSARTEPDKFWLLNNGMTLIADDLAKHGNAIDVTNPQIVNGGQTLFSLIASLDGQNNLREGQANVLARIVVLDLPLRGTTERDESEGAHLSREISESTNRQNKITPADLRSNDEVQQKLAVALSRTMPAWFYERKRNGRAALTPDQKRTYEGIITKDDLGQRWRAFDGEPAMAIKAKSKMYADDESGTRLYQRVFDASRDPYEYICAYLLFEEFRQRRAQLPRYAAELARSQNLWAAHCTALTKIAVERRGKLDARSVSDSALNGHLDDLLAGIERLGVSWLKGRILAARRAEENLQIKSVMEDVATFEEWIAYLDDENEGIAAAVDGLHAK